MVRRGESSVLFERLIAFLVVLAVLFWIAHASDGLPWSVPEASLEEEAPARSLQLVPFASTASEDEDENENEDEDDDEDEHDDDDDDKEENREKERKKKGRGHDKRGRG